MPSTTALDAWRLSRLPVGCPLRPPDRRRAGTGGALCPALARGAARRRALFSLLPRPGLMRASLPMTALARALHLERLPADSVARLRSLRACRCGGRSRACRARPRNARRSAAGARRAAPGLCAASLVRARERRDRAGARRRGLRRRHSDPAALLRRAAAPCRRGGRGAGERPRDDRGTRGLRANRGERGRLRVGDEGLRSRVPRRPGVEGARRSVRGEGARCARAACGDRAVRAAPPGAAAIAYHDACTSPIAGHPSRAPGPAAGHSRARAARARGWELCCGSAGVYNLLQPETAAELGRRKAEALLATGAEAVVAANPGCAVQITAHAAALGRGAARVPPMELLARSIG